jgi:hypothetical protein
MIGHIENEVEEIKKLAIHKEGVVSENTINQRSKEIK